jgi:hypothetical protein
MKKLFTLSLIVFAYTFQVSAQLKKGEVALGGTLSFNSATSDAGPNTAEYKATSISIMPQLGFGIGGNWILGFGAGFTDYKEKSTGGLYGSEQTADIYTGGIFARKSFPIGERFGIFGQADAAYDAGKGEYESGSSVSKQEFKRINLSVSPGAYLRASRRFIIETSIGGISYTQVKNKIDGGQENKSRSFDITLASTLTLAFRVVL